MYWNRYGKVDMHRGKNGRNKKIYDIEAADIFIMDTVYKFEEQSISDVYKIAPFSSSDFRGSGIKDFSEEFFNKNGICFQPREILTIRSKKGVLRGIHFQRIKGQAKLIRCIVGSLWCVVVDIRKDSETFGQWISVDISGGMEIYVPGDCAVGTLALDNSIMICTCDEKYYKNFSDGIRWDDRELGVKWPLDRIGGVPVLSRNDKELGNFSRLINVEEIF